MKKVIGSLVALVVVIGIVALGMNGISSDNEVIHSAGLSGVAIQEQDTNVAGDSPVLNEATDEIGSILMEGLSN